MYFDNSTIFYKGVLRETASNLQPYNGDKLPYLLDILKGQASWQRFYDEVI